jgi:hypothetical protein
LHNPIYAGYLRWENIIQKWTNEPIISKDDFNLIQQRLNANRRNKAKKNKLKMNDNKGKNVIRDKNDDEPSILMLT